MRLLIKYFLLCAGMIMYVLSSEAQSFQGGNHWFFGDSIWLEFSDTGIIQRKANISSREASSSINHLGTDSLLYYSTAVKVYDKYGTEIGSGLYGDNSATQGSVFVRHPDNDSLIHLFTSDDINATLSTGMYHHVINSNGVIVSKNDTITYHKTEQLGVINHRNNRDIWIATHEAKSDKFLLFLLKADQIVDCPVEYESIVSYEKSIFEGTTLKFSPNGSILGGALLSSGRLELYKFDNENGLLDQPIVITQPKNNWSIEFSPNSQMLYLSSEELDQYSLDTFDKNSIATSKVLIDPYVNGHLGHLQLALDGKIYMGLPDSSFISTIHSPSEKGANCNFERHGVVFTQGKCRKGLPTFNQSIFFTPAVNFAYAEDCEDLNYTFTATDSIDATNYKWTFRQQGSSEESSKTGREITFQFPDTGVWDVRLVASDGIRSDSVAKKLTIRPKWERDFLGQDTSYCKGTDFDLVLQAPTDLHCIHWMGNPSYSQPDTFRIDSAGMYFVKVTNKSFCITYDTITVKELPLQVAPILYLSNDTLFTTGSGNQYTWYRNEAIYHNGTDSFLEISENGSYTLRVKYANACQSDFSDSVVVNCQTAPNRNIPVLSANGDTLWSTVQNDNIVYIWYIDSNEITQTLYPYIIPSMNGNYQVKTINDRGCIGQFSNGFDVNWLDVGTLDVSQFKLYPNPVNRILHVESSFSVQQYTVEIINVFGDIVYFTESTSQNLNIDMSTFASQLYTVRIKDEESEMNFRICLLR